MRRAEIALEYSIRKYASGPVSITFLRSGDDGWRTNVDEGLTPEESRAHRPDLWNIGRSHDRPCSNEGWYTSFSCFRFAIPELCGFEGTCVHLDVDFLFLGDIYELANVSLTAPMTGPFGCRTDMMVIDCARFRGLDWWPSVQEMRPSGWHLRHHYRELLSQHGFLGDAPEWLESLDGADWSGGTRQNSRGHLALHFTNMSTQPWKPLPQHITYLDHPIAAAAITWWEHYAEALEFSGLGKPAASSRLQPRQST